jgi:hypothetical protein
MIESVYAIKNNLKPIEISKQELVECVNLRVDFHGGCDGGSPVYAMEYMKNYPISTEKDYSYKNMKGPKCHAPKYDKKTKKLVDEKEKSRLLSISPLIKDYSIFDKVTSKELYKILLKGPVAVQIDASPKEFVFFKSGILRMNCSNKSNHAVLLVGFGVEKGIEYWKIKNSWGTDWGEKGYFRLENNINWDSCNIFKNVMEVEAFEEESSRLAREAKTQQEQVNTESNEIKTGSEEII